MFWKLFLFPLILTVSGEIARKICYDHVGCFNNVKPFDNTEDLPADPTKLQDKYLLYTRDTVDSPEHLDYRSQQSLTTSHFDAQKSVKFIIHGFFGHATNQWVIDMKDALLKKGDFNVVIVGWDKGAAWPYGQAVANVRLVGTEIKLLLDMMTALGCSLSQVHLIGHSLGAHVSGYTGYLTGGKLGRISALDPAQQMYEVADKVVRVDKTDALFVDSIHTDTRSSTISFGFREPVGHVDFFPNGGYEQPGCNTIYKFVKGKITSTFHGLKNIFTPLYEFFGKRSLEKRNKLTKQVACSHMRSHDYYVQSILACQFKSLPCNSYESFEKGECMSCSNGQCGVMGFEADQFSGRGSQYLKTLSKLPFCGSQYKVLVTLGRQIISKGNLTIKLENGQGASALGYLDMSHAKSNGHSIEGLIIAHGMHPVKKFSLKFHDDDHDWIPIVVKEIEVSSLDTGFRYKSPTSWYLVYSGEYLELPVDRTLSNLFDQ